MDKGLNYVSSIQNNNIVITCSSKDKIKILKAMGAKTGWFQINPWYLNYSSEQDLINKLEKLRESDFMFGGRMVGLQLQFFVISEKNIIYWVK